MSDTPFYEQDGVTVFLGDCLDVMRGMPDNSIDSIVTDPPYGLQFMGKEWDNLWRNKPGADKEYKERNAGKLTGRLRDLPDYSSTDQAAMQYWHYEWAKEALRVAKPGAFLMAFGGTRTYHRLACAIEDAGWEIRDCINYLNDGTQAEQAFMASLDEEQLAAYLELHYPNRQMSWVYGSGIGLGYDVSKGIDKRAGKEREVVGENPNGRFTVPSYKNDGRKTVNPLGKNGITAPATPLAAKFDGYKSRLKGSFEPIIVAMKPMEGGFAENAERWGIAGLNIDGCRVPTNGEGVPLFLNGIDRARNRSSYDTGGSNRTGEVSTQGRYPANTIHSAEPGVMAEFAKAGVSGGGKLTRNNNVNRTAISTRSHNPRNPNATDSVCNFGDTGTPSRYFAQCPPDEWSRFVYQAKAGKKERGKGNNHPTVKPLSLVRQLVRLCRPPDGGVVLDMFGGSGTTALACRAENMECILIDKEEPYCQIAVNRLKGQTDVTPPQTEARETGPQVKQLSIMDSING